MEETIYQILKAIFSVDSIWSVVLRGGIWLAISLVIVISTDNPNPDKSLSNLKSNLGFFLMFLVLTGGLIGLLFSYTRV